MSPRRTDLPPLTRADLDPDPLAQLGAWYADAEREVPLSDAVTLATVDARGAPDARMVLLKGFGANGLRFFTSYESVKAGQLEAAPRAALVIYWRELDRQVRARGEVQRLDPAESDAYFETRPRDSQLGAWASPQSRVLDSREELDARLAEVVRRFEGAVVPRPGHWGGYLLRPRTIEFWQGRVGRLHDRFRYTHGADGWRLERLGP